VNRLHLVVLFIATAACGGPGWDLSGQYRGKVTSSTNGNCSDSPSSWDGTVMLIRQPNGKYLMNVDSAGPFTMVQSGSEAKSEPPLSESSYDATANVALNESRTELNLTLVFTSKTSDCVSTHLGTMRRVGQDGGP
jgi:hypothetical protein